MARIIHRIGSEISNLTFIKPLNRNIVIEGGGRAWSSNYFIELENSLKEYIEPDTGITKLVIPRRKFYILYIYKCLKNRNITHYVHDPRTGSQNSFVAVLESFIITFLFAYYRITLISILTDCSIRQWRFQSSIVTINTGVIVTFLEIKYFGKLLKNYRIIGCSLMPLSISTFEFINQINKKYSNANAEINRNLYFLGSVYGYRKHLFEEVNLLSNLSEKRPFIEYEAKLDGDYFEYWEKLIKKRNFITTCTQVKSAGYKFDLPDLTQIVFRITEVLASGSLLFCFPVPGLQKYFKESEDYIPILENSHYLHSLQDKFTDITKSRQSISTSAKNIMKDYVYYQTFWRNIDDNLQSRVKPSISEIKQDKS
jgi:hypothetical protein